MQHTALVPTSTQTHPYTYTLYYLQTNTNPMGLSRLQPTPGSDGDFRSPDISISAALSFEGDRDHSSFPDVNFSQPIGLVLVSLGVRKRVGTGRKRKRQE